MSPLLAVLLLAAAAALGEGDDEGLATLLHGLEELADKAREWEAGAEGRRSGVGANATLDRQLAEQL